MWSIFFVDPELILLTPPGDQISNSEISELILVSREVSLALKWRSVRHPPLAGLISQFICIFAVCTVCICISTALFVLFTAGQCGGEGKKGGGDV